MVRDMFVNRSASPMLIKDEREAFDSPGWIYELKLDGIRCLAYADKGRVLLQNKRGRILNNVYPELSGIHGQARKRCILDGELIVLSGGKPDFAELQRRSLMTNRFRIELAAKEKPARFVAYDILYLVDRPITGEPLLNRKEALNNVIDETEELAISRFIQEKGIELFQLTAEQALEGVVAKQKDSLYRMGKRSKDWVKFKTLHDDDFLICGYESNTNGRIVSLVLGSCCGNRIIYQGRVAFGSSSEIASIILQQPVISCPFERKESSIIYIKPNLVCTVRYMMRTESGMLRQPVFKGLALDKSPTECIING